MSAAESLHDVVAHGLCIGCGLCEAMAGPDRIRMTMTEEGRLRPLLSPLQAADEARILQVCPGAHVSAEAEPGTEVDPIWGAYRGLRMPWSGYSEIRHKAAWTNLFLCLTATDSGVCLRGNFRPFEATAAHTDSVRPPAGSCIILW